MTDTAIAAAYARALDREARRVTIRRTNGSPPNVRTVSAVVRAAVRTDVPDPTAAAAQGYGSPVGALTQDDRQIIVLEADLRAARFPLPVDKGDLVVLPNGDVLTIARVDAETRRLAGALVLVASGA